MIILQIVNVLSQEIVREEMYEKPDIIQTIIRSGEEQSKSKAQTFIFDENKRTLDAEYITHTIIEEGTDTFYRLFYKLKMAEVQAVIK